MKNSKLAMLFIMGIVPTIALALSQDPKGVPDPVKRILLRNCSVAGCHQGAYPAQNLNLDPEKIWASAVNTASRENPSLKIIDPAEPEKSYLLLKIRGDKGIDGKRMPYGADPLKAADIQAIRDWLADLKGRGGEIVALQGPESAPQKIIFEKPAFWGTRLINLPTTQSLDKGRFLFQISHRFTEPVGSGYRAFYGLDSPAQILFGFGYGFSDTLALTLGRTNLDQEFEMALHWRLLEQEGSGRFPFSAAIHLGGTLITMSQSGRNLLAPENVDFNCQLSLVRQLDDRLSLLVVPSFGTNTNHVVDLKGTFALGIGARWMIVDDISIIGEWVPVLSGYKAAASGWGIGIEKKIGGHVFQLFVLNGAGLLPDQYLPGGDLMHDVRLGFNIFRMF